MVKLLGVVFALLLAGAHLADLHGDALHRPMSMFRDYEPEWIGYALFGVLVAIGLATVRTAFRVGAEAHVAFYLAATWLLTMIAVTPSDGELHVMCALTAMLAMYAYYAALLYQGDSIFLFVMHLSSPTVFLMASRRESYGVWQKAMILYFLAAIVVHEGQLAKWLSERKRGRVRRVQTHVGRKQAA